MIERKERNLRNSAQTRLSIKYRGRHTKIYKVGIAGKGESTNERDNNNYICEQ